MKVLLVLLGVAGAAMAQGKCKKRMMRCMAGGYSDFQSSTLDDWSPVIMDKVQMKMDLCAAKSRCVRNMDCFMAEGMKFKEGVESCAPIVAMYKDMDPAAMKEMKMMKMLKLIGDKPKLSLFAQAVCHPDDARRYAKCLRKAAEPAFLVKGPKLLHMMLNKKTCIKGLSKKCKAEWAGMVENSCQCTADLGDQLDAMEKQITGQCGAFPEGVEAEKIHAFMSAKYCSSKKDKLCYKSAKKCMKASMPENMAKFESMPGAKKAKLMLALMKDIMPKMTQCFAAKAGQCVQDIECGMKAVGKYKRKVEGCEGLVQRWAFMPKEGRMKLKMMKMVELVMGDEMGPQIMNAMCATAEAGAELRSCLQTAVPEEFQPMLKGGLDWFKEAFGGCLGQASEECQGRFAAKMADKCSCATALGQQADKIFAFVQKKCGDTNVPDGSVNFATIFNVKQTKYCAPIAGPSQ